jgi:hypothetical protein
LAGVAASSQLPREWARDHGIDGRSLYWWRLRLAAESPTPLRMVELVPAQPLAASERGGRYLIHSGPFTVEVDASFDEPALTRVLRAVAAC